MHLKSVTLFVMIIIIILVGSGNAARLAEVEVGAGPNFGYLAYDEPLEIWDVGWALGFSGGIYLEIFLSNRISLVPSTRFTNLTNNVEIDNPVIKGEFEVNHKMISVPVLFRYELKENMLFIDAGPELSFFLSSELKSDYMEFGTPHKETDDISDEVESYNIGACIRIGFKAYQWNIPVAITAAYHHGFKGVAAGDYWWSDWKTREITLSVYYLFDLSK